MTRVIKNWLTDMDGVLIHEEKALPGAADFLNKLNEKSTPISFLPIIRFLPGVIFPRG